MDLLRTISLTGILLIAAVLSCPSETADAPQSAEAMSARAEISNIRLLLRLNGSEELAKQLGSAMAQAVIANSRKANPNLPVHTEAVIYSVLEEYVREQSHQDALIDLLVPVYAKYLTKQDIDQLIIFYQSPIGKKLASVTPAISLDSTKIGQQWAESIAPELRAKLVEALKSER